MPNGERATPAGPPNEKGEAGGTASAGCAAPLLAKGDEASGCTMPNGEGAVPAAPPSEKGEAGCEVACWMLKGLADPLSPDVGLIVKGEIVASPEAFSVLAPGNDMPNGLVGNAGA
jgi:hypothetical protein